MRAVLRAATTKRADNVVQAIGIVAAGGIGARMGAPGGKQLLEIDGRPMVAWSVQAMCDIPCIDEVVVVCDPSRVEQYAQEIVRNVEGDTPLTFVAGGDTRTQSVRNGLDAIEGKEDTVVLIHDGARPLASSEMMQRALQAFVDTPEADGLVVGHPSVDTLKHVEGLRVIETPQRTAYWMVQTPQIFSLETLLQAYEHLSDDSPVPTDDSSLVEAAGCTVMMYEGSRDNIKVTNPEDVTFVQAVLQLRRET